MAVNKVDLHESIIFLQYMQLGKLVLSRTLSRKIREAMALSASGDNRG